MVGIRLVCRDSWQHLWLIAETLIVSRIICHPSVCLLCVSSQLHFEK